MRWSLDSLRLQAAVIGLASLSMAALAVILIQDALSRAEQTLLREAEQQSTRFCRHPAPGATSWCNGSFAFLTFPKKSHNPGDDRPGPLPPG